MAALPVTTTGDRAWRAALAPRLHRSPLRLRFTLIGSIYGDAAGNHAVRYGRVLHAAAHGEPPA